MRKTVCFSIPGKVTGKGRHRMTHTGRAYTPANTVEYEKFVRLCYADRPMLEGAFSLLIVASFAPPKSMSARKRCALLGTPATKKPDIDNIEKIICDALNGVAYRDDAACALATIVKLWGETEGVWVTLTELDEIKSLRETTSELVEITTRGGEKA